MDFEKLSGIFRDFWKDFREKLRISAEMFRALFGIFVSRPTASKIRVT